MPTDPQSVRMSLGDHLDELRKRLIWGLIGPVVAGVVLLVFGKDVVAWLCQPVLYALAAEGLPPTLYAGGVSESFTIYMRVSLIGGLVIGIPWLVYQLWRFVAPGLYPTERRFVYMLMPGSVLLSIAGVLFMYFVLLPITLSFLIQWTINYPMPTLDGSIVQRKIQELYSPEQADGEPVNQAPAIWPRRMEDPVDPPDGSVWLNVPQRSLKAVIDGKVMSLPLTVEQRMASPWFTMNQYIGFVLMLALGCALGFQTPMVMLALSWTGLVDRKVFARGRRWAILACTILGAVLTPPDVGSQLLLGGSMYLLFEIGLVLIWLTGRRKRPARE